MRLNQKTNLLLLGIELDEVIEQRPISTMFRGRYQQKQFKVEVFFHESIYKSTFKTNLFYHVKKNLMKLNCLPELMVHHQIQTDNFFIRLIDESVKG